MEYHLPEKRPSSPRLGPVVGDLTKTNPAVPGRAPEPEGRKLHAGTGFPPVDRPVFPRPSPARKAVPVLGILLVAALSALAWFMLKAPEEPENAWFGSSDSAAPGEPAVGNGVHDAGIQPDGGTDGEAHSSGPSAAETPVKNLVSLEDPVVKKAIRSYIRPSAGSQELLLETIKKSDHVAEKFADVAAGVEFVYLLDDDRVNADSYLEKNADGTPCGRVRLYGGLVRMARAMGAVLTFGEDADGDGGLEFLHDLGVSIRDHGWKFDEKTLAETLAAGKADPEGFVDTVRRSQAETIANAVVMSVMAHEFGHLAKGHLNGDDANHVVSQLEEKEADLFASTIAASAPDGPKVFAGQVLSMLVFSFAEDGADASVSGGGEPRGLRLHPVSRERVLDAVRANPEFAAAAGVSEEEVREFFEKLDEKKGE